LLVAVLLNGAVPLLAQSDDPISATHFKDAVKPVLVKVCSECHASDDGDHKVPFLKAMTVDDVTSQRGLWRNVATQLRNRTMPPADEEQPSEAERLALSQWIERVLKASACDGGESAGPVTARRLNRDEYDNTIRDLTGLDLSLSQLFPVDGAGGEGFDNNGETLFLPPLLMERYLEAAQTIVDRMVIIPRLQREWTESEFIPATSDPGPNDQKMKTRTIEPETEAGVILSIHTDGTYRVRMTFSPQAKPSRAVVHVDGIPAERWDIAPSKEAIKQTFDLRLARGDHSIAVRIPAEKPPVSLRTIGIVQNEVKRSDAEVRAFQHLFDGITETTRDDAKTILSRFTRRAFRRPVTDRELQRFMSLFDRAHERGDPFHAAIRLPLKAVLVSPQFLFRIEPEKNADTLMGDRGAIPLDSHSIAVRLSYFLWASMPDDELFRLAETNALQQSEILEAQVKRMLADPKANEFAKAFVGQWLGTREVGRLIAPSTDKFKDQFTTELLIDFRAEPVHFFEHLLQENGNLLDFVNGNYSYLNKRLAKHYSIKDHNTFSNNRFQKVTFEKRRGGVLGMGSVHLLTSYPDRTSVVLRGAWVLETLLGTQVPSPPDDIPPLKQAKVAKGASIRQQLAKHREHQSCAACHNLIDPIGFGLDNFDLLSRWREKDRKHPIDATGTMPSGETFNGPDGLKELLKSRKSEFIEHLSRKMLGYALGRSLEDADQCTVDKIVDVVTKEDYKTQTLIREIVLSVPFRNREPSKTADP